MKTKLGVPIVVERIKIEGPEAIREVDLLLDTGARFTSLSHEILRDIGYDPAVVSEKVKILTANGVIEVPLIKVRRVCLKELCCENVEVIALTIPEFVEVDGLLGLSFLCYFKTVLNYKKGILEIV